MIASAIMSTLAHAGESHGGGFRLPPIHPILVNFTAALVPTSFVLDLFGRVLRRDSLRHAGWWTLVTAAVVIPLTVWAGWAWLGDMPAMNAWQEMSIHKWLGTTLAAMLPFLA